MVNRVRPLLSKLIDPSQAAFVPGRWIAENVVIAQEIVHNFKKTKKRHGSVGFKLDFNKAYDRLEWGFILAILRAMGFGQKFIKLIYQCLSSMNDTLLLNGSKSCSFSPTRGIRQGDPLSPYLFILCNEVLVCIINWESSRGSIKGVKVSPKAPSISILFYADDVLLFCGAKMVEVDVLMKSVEDFCSWSSLLLSKDKSGSFVSKRVHSQFVRQIKNQWSSKQLKKDSKYLGLPLFISANK